MKTKISKDENKNINDLLYYEIIWNLRSTLIQVARDL